jgi:hypothetical protein
MTRSYKLVLLEDAVPGMVLSDNLLDRHGKILLPENTELTEKLLESLHRYEMEMVPVFCDELTDEEKAEKIAQRQARLSALFRKQNYDSPAEYANDVLMQCLVEFRQGEGS